MNNSKSCPPCSGECSQGDACPAREPLRSNWSPVVNVVLILVVFGIMALVSSLWRQA
jgi:hypothetical protein